MRHRRKGRQLGRSSSHRKAMLRNLACSLILTERDPEYYEDMFQSDGKTPVNPPKFQGRVVTTIHKAKEVRPLVEKCITLARKAIPHLEKAEQFATTEDRNTEAWRKWRESDQWSQWNEAMAPAITLRRRAFSILRDRDAVDILFNDLGPRFAKRDGGYTRIMKMAQPRLGDAGVQAVLEFVGVHDRVKAKAKADKPDFGGGEETKEPAKEPEAKAEKVDEKPADDAPVEEAAEETTEAADDAADE